MATMNDTDTKIRTDAYILTLLRFANKEPGMEKHLQTLSETFTEQQQEMLRLLAVETATLWIIVAKHENADPEDYYTHNKYPPIP